MGIVKEPTIKTAKMAQYYEQTQSYKCTEEVSHVIVMSRHDQIIREKEREEERIECHTLPLPSSVSSALLYVFLISSNLESASLSVSTV